MSLPIDVWEAVVGPAVGPFLDIEIPFDVVATPAQPFQFENVGL